MAPPQQSAWVVSHCTVVSSSSWPLVQTVEHSTYGLVVAIPAVVRDVTVRAAASEVVRSRVFMGSPFAVRRPSPWPEGCRGRYTGKGAGEGRGRAPAAARGLIPGRPLPPAPPSGYPLPL